MGAQLWNAADNTRQLIVQHTTESEGGNTSVIGYLERNRSGSYQTMVDFDGEEVRMVPDDRQAWGAMNEGNRRGLHVCAMGRAAWDRNRWLSEPKLLERTAMRYAEWSRRYGIPLHKISAAQARAGERGIVGHIDISEAWRESDHWDPGRNFPYDVVIARAIEINGGAPATPPQEDDMPSAAEIAKALLETRIQRPDGRPGETVGNVLAWIDQHAAQLVVEALGPGSEAIRGPVVDPKRWPELGDRTQVEALAALLTAAGVAPRGQ
ncbi:peptidoglycan recognition protein family protein [Nocardia sp. IFM 10818]